MSKHFIVTRAPKQVKFKAPLTEAEKLETLAKKTAEEKRFIRVYGSEMPKRVKGRSKRGWVALAK